jgi:hypothetical protein
VSDPVVTFAIKLDTDADSTEDAAKVLEKLREQIDGDTTALRQMQAAMKAMQGAATVDVAVFKRLRDEINAKKVAIGGANQEFIKLGGTFGKVAKQAEGFAAPLEQVAEPVKAAVHQFEDYANAVKGPLGPMGASSNAPASWPKGLAS